MKRKVFLLVLRIKRLLKSFSFYSNKFRLSLFLLALFLIIYLLPIKFPIPYPANLDEQVSSQLLATIASALASILAIVFAIILIGFEIIYKTFRGYVKKALWQNENFKELSILYVMSVIFVVFSLGTLDSSIRSFNLIIFSLYLFFVCLVVLFPYIRGLISDVISPKGIKDLVELLDKKQGYSLRRRVANPDVLSGYIEDVENDPLFVLGEVASNYLKEDNSIRAYFTLVEVTRKLLKQAETTTDFRRFIKKYLDFYRKISHQAIKNNNEGMLEVIFDMIREIHRFCAQNKKIWHEMIELNEAMTEIVSECIKKGFAGVARRALYLIPTIFEDHLKNNSPKEEEIWILNFNNGKPPEKPNYELSNHWDHISHGYFRIQEDLTRVAMDEGFATLASAGIQGFHSMVHSIHSANNLGDKQIGDVLTYLSFTAQQLMLDCSEKAFWRTMVKISPFEAFTITECIDKNKSYSNILLVDAVELQLKLLKHKKLPIFDLNDLGTAGRQCIGKITKTGDIYEQAVEFLVKGFSEMRKILGKNLSESQYGIYLEVYKQLDSLRRWKGKKSKSLSRKIKSALSKFTKVKSIKIKVKKSTIKWPKSVK